ncbi:hypothetical protein ACFCYN_20240 [Gottfriedia sp. NPDC056225]
MISTLTTILGLIQATALMTTIVSTIASALHAKKAKGSETNG